MRPGRGVAMISEEANYLIRRAFTQLDLARRAALRNVAVIHLEMTSRYLEQAQLLIDAERRVGERGNVVSIRR